MKDLLTLNSLENVRATVGEGGQMGVVSGWGSLTDNKATR